MPFRDLATLAFCAAIIIMIVTALGSPSDKLRPPDGDPEEEDRNERKATFAFLALLVGCLGFGTLLGVFSRALKESFPIFLRWLF